jgi:hypothetical protein
MKNKFDGATKPSTKKLIIPITDNNEFFSEVADYLTADLNVEKIDHIRRFSAVVRDLEVYRISAFDCDCEFLISDYEAAPKNGKVAMKEFKGRMECTTLNVTDSDFYWSGYYRHTSVRWESESVPLSVLDEDGEYDLRKAIGAVEDTGPDTRF